MNKKGFTLIELLIVVAIIGIIAAIAIPNLLIALQKGKQKATMGDMRTIGVAIDSYIVDWSFSPNQPGGAEGDIEALLDLGWFRPFYIKVLPLTDGWGRQFRYERGILGAFDQDAYSLHSWGKDHLVTNAEVMEEYELYSMTDFNKDITYANGQFTVCPRTKR